MPYFVNKSFEPEMKVKLLSKTTEKPGRRYSPWGCKESDTTEQLSLDFLCGSDGKASTYNEGDPGSIPGSERSSGEGNGNPLKYSCLENPMYGGVW